MRLPRLAVPACLAVVLMSSGASAQEGWVPKTMYNRVGAEFDFWSTKGFQGYSWDIEAQLAVTKKVMIDIDVPFGYAHTGTTELTPAGGVTIGSSSGKFVFGNLTGGAHWADKVSPELAVFAGATLSIPTQTFNIKSIDGFDTIFAAALLSTMRAEYDAFRFIPGEITLRPRGGIEYRPIPILYLRVDVAPSFFAPTQDGGKGAVFLDQGNEFEARIFGFGGGLRLQETFALAVPDSGGNADRAQTAMEPFIGYEAPREGVYARLGLLVALDKDLGFGFDQGKLATLRANVGGKF